MTAQAAPPDWRDVYPDWLNMTTKEQEDADRVWGKYTIDERAKFAAGAREWQDGLKASIERAGFTNAADFLDFQHGEYKRNFGGRANGPDHEPDHLKGMDADALLDLDLPPLQQAIAGLLPEGLGVLGAPPKAGKSLLAYQCGVEMAFGGDIFGIAVEQRQVRYYALEDGRRRSQQRVRALLRGRRRGIGNLGLRWTAPRLGGGLEEEISRWLDAHPLGVCIVDVLSKVRPSGRAGLNAYDEDYATLEPLHAVVKAHPGSTVLIVTHDRKAGSSDWLTRITGTRGVTGAADFVIFIARDRGAPMAAIHVTGRDIEDASYNVEFTGSGWQSADPQLLIGAASPTRQTIWNWVKEHGPCWPKAVSDATGLDPTTVRVRMPEMVKAGQLFDGPLGYTTEDPAPPPSTGKQTPPAQAPVSAVTAVTPQLWNGSGQPVGPESYGVTGVMGVYVGEDQEQPKMADPDADEPVAASDAITPSHNTSMPEPPPLECGHPWSEGSRVWLDGVATDEVRCRACSAQSDGLTPEDADVVREVT